MAGRLAPFIELGVGFNPELTARENVELNGVMMGLTRREARSRLGAVLEFAELEEFVDLKLKNYSSGMLVRLAFSVMIQSDAEILLIDEVLAVGDASFQQKCADVFHEIRDSERTVVFVTHDMGAVEQYCHRAMLLHDGEVKAIGDAGEVARKLPAAQLRAGAERRRRRHRWSRRRRPRRRLARGRRRERGHQRREGQRAALRRRPSRPTGRSRGRASASSFANADGVEVTGFGLGLAERRCPTGSRPASGCGSAGTIENRLAPGRYVVKCWVHRDHNYADLVLHSPHVLDFVVFGKGDAGRGRRSITRCDGETGGGLVSDEPATTPGAA